VEKAKCEFNSLLVGMILNFIFMILGIVFYARTHSSSMLLDAAVSAVLSITTLVSIIVSHNVNKRATSKYPLGRYAIENMFLLFRSMSMIAVVIFSIIEGSVTIFDFYVNKGDVAYDATNTELVIYGILTAILGFGIAITYFVNYLRSKKTSEILKLELKGSIYDIMVNTFAIISLLLFANVSFLKEWQGVRSDVSVSLYENDKLIKKEIGEIQLTDYGVSGVCVFQLSSLVSRGLYNSCREKKLSLQR